MDDFDIWLAVVDEDDEEQDQPPGHPDDLITLFSIALDEVVVPRFFSALAESRVNLALISHYCIFNNHKSRSQSAVVIAMLSLDIWRTLPSDAWTTGLRRSSAYVQPVTAGPWKRRRVKF